MEFRVKPAARLVSSIPKPYKEAKSGWVHLAAPKMAENPWVENLGECQVWFGQVGSVGWWGLWALSPNVTGMRVREPHPKANQYVCQPGGLQIVWCGAAKKTIQFQAKCPCSAPFDVCKDSNNASALSAKNLVICGRDLSFGDSIGHFSSFLVPSVWGVHFRLYLVNPLGGGGRLEP